MSQGRIISIVYQDQASVYQRPYQFRRNEIDSVRLKADFGIEGDLKARKGSKRQVNIMDQQTVASLAERGYKTDPGQLGEQLVISGLNMPQLPVGQRLQLGDEAVIEKTCMRTPCQWFEKIQGKTIAESRNLIGLMCRVVSGGTIRVGDAVRLL